MAKQLWFTNVAATTHRGDNTAKLAGATSWWQPFAMSESRGASATTVTVASTAGTTVGLEFVSGAVALEWLSEPLSADFTIAGTITGNLWGFESTMNDNTAINFVVDKIDGATRAITQIAKSARVTELATSNGVNNFTVSPTSTACKRGDRIRVRPFIDDAGAAMIVGTSTFSHNGATASAAGDSWIQFTENLTFEPVGDPAPSIDQPTISTGEFFGVGGTTGTYGVAQQFSIPGTTLTEVSAVLSDNAPTDNLVVTVVTDSGRLPSTTVVATVATAAASTIDFQTRLTWATSIALTPDTSYWLVFRRSGAQSSGTDYYELVAANNAVSRLAKAALALAGPNAWAAKGGTFTFTVRLRYSGAPATTSVYYCTDTAETINPGSATEKQAATTRGGGTVSSITNTAAGPTAGIQITGSAGGTALEWFTPQLEAVTLGGRAKFNIRALESSAAANASLKAEVAIVDSAGAGAAVWGVAHVEAANSGEIGAANAALVAWVAGDDTAVTAGQRLRFRVYVDDIASGPLVTGHTVTVSYNGTSASAAGDTYVVLPVIVVEQGAGGTAHTATPADTLVLADLLGRLRASVRTPADTVALADSVKRQKVIPAVFTRSLDLRL